MAQTFQSTSHTSIMSHSIKPQRPDLAIVVLTLAIMLWVLHFYKDAFHG